MNRPLIVFQSDDWGTQRIPSGIESRIQFDYLNEFLQFDTLEDKDDLDNLKWEVENIATQICKPVNFTLNIVSGNPNFSKIRANGFQKYFVQDLDQSYSYYGFNQAQIKVQWFHISNSASFDLQFHSREHVNSQLWLKALQKRDQMTEAAFDLGFWGLSTNYTRTSHKSFMATWDEKPMETDELTFQEGIKLFKDYFNIKPISFVPNNYIFPIGNIKFVEKNEIKSIQGREYLIQPQKSKFFRFRKKVPRKMGNIEKGSNSLISIVRNVQFEPSKDLFSNKHNKPFTPQIDLAMNQINLALMKGLPAVIDTHRVNYVGARSEENRDYGFSQLKKLVLRIHDSFPNAEFISTTELTNRLNAIHQ